MSAAFVKCPSCRHVVRRAPVSCPLCRRPFGDFRDALSPETRDILEALSGGPLTGATLHETLDRADNSRPGMRARLGEQLLQLEEHGFVLSLGDDAQSSPTLRRYWITGQGREAVETGTPARSAASSPETVPALRRPSLPWRMIPRRAASRTTHRPVSPPSFASPVS
jgi:hypothetical protein